MPGWHRFAIIGKTRREQSSILSGTLARIDRDASGYGAGATTTVNTFYFQAVSPVPRAVPPDRR